MCREVCIAFIHCHCTAFDLRGQGELLLNGIVLRISIEAGLTLFISRIDALTYSIMCFSYLFLVNSVGIVPAVVNASRNVFRDIPGALGVDSRHTIVI